MKPLIHANLSVKKHGGTIDDYMAIHEFIDSSKAVVADMRHRAMLHSAWGIYVVEKVFGPVLINSDLKQISVRDIAEEHVMQDLGFIPTMQDWIQEIPMKGWMTGTKKRTRRIDFD